DRNGEVRACKFFYSLHRVEQINHHEFRFLHTVAAQNIPASITRDLSQFRQNFAFQQTLVSVGVLRLRPTTPMSCNHVAIITRRIIAPWSCKIETATARFPRPLFTIAKRAQLCPKTTVAPPAFALRPASPKCSRAA